MFIVKWIVVVIAAMALGAIAAGQLGLFSSTAPTDIGVRDGRLKPPSATQNSVTSQAALYPDHPQRADAAVAALALRGDGAATMVKLKTAVEALPGARVVKSTPDYLYAQVTTPVMKFVDDLEFWFDPAAQAVQVRSASRVGQSDMGVNRQRVEAVRAALAAAP